VAAVSQRVKIRPPAAAGLFYEGNPQRLKATVADLLAEAPTHAAATAAPKALIAPHAGYVYSGRIAAAAFSTLRGRADRVERVVLIGPAHFVPVRGIAAPAADAFETPLGCVRIDRLALSTLTDLPAVIESDAPHAPEHSLEVELPFLQELMESFTVVPLVIGQATPAAVAAVLERLWGGAETLIVVSSDLSHYHDYDTARRLDAATASSLECGDWESLRPDRACGWLAVAGLLIEAGRRGLAAQRLALCNSGDTAGTRDRVVGYGAWMFASA
jgi:MEMO1 family protein